MISKLVKIYIPLVIIFTISLSFLPLKIDGMLASNCLYDSLSTTANAAGWSKYNPGRQSNPDPIEQSHCNLYEQYRPYIVEAMRKYYPVTNYAFPILSPSIMGGLMFEESRFGLILKPQGCNGRGDYVSGKTKDTRKIGYHGHGLGQADPSSKDGLASTSWKEGAIVKVTYRGTTDKYVWNDCRDGIFYAVGHLIKIVEAAAPTAIAKLKAAGLNMARKPNGLFIDPKVQKAYSVLVLAANNAGPTGMKDRCFVDRQAFVDESCTNNKHYAEMIYKSSVNLYKCFNNKITMDEQLNKVWDFE